jgi:acyl carrier protein
VPAETHVSHSPLSPDELLAIVREHLADVLLIDPTEIDIDAKLREDLDADDLTLLDAVEAIEEELGDRTVGFRFPDEAIADLRTVRDMVDFVLAHFAKPPA